MLSLPRENTVMDLKTQSASVQSKATFVPLKFANMGGSNKSHVGGSFSSPAKKEDSSHGESVADAVIAQMNMFSKWANNSHEQLRNDEDIRRGHVRGAEGSVALQTGEDAPAAPFPHRTSSTGALGQLLAGTGLAATTEGEEDNASNSNQPLMGLRSKLTRRSSLGSFRLAGRIDDLLVEHGETPLAVMCRRDFLKAQQDEMLLKSDKNYIRRPIEKKIGLSRSSFEGSSAVSGLRSSFVLPDGSSAVSPHKIGLRSSFVLPDGSSAVSPHKIGLRSSFVLPVIEDTS
jgi:hypothetical protein